MSYHDPKLDPRFKPHWPAIVRSADGRHFVTNHLYWREDEAKGDIGPGFVRLARETPPIYVPPIGISYQAPAPEPSQPRATPRPNPPPVQPNLPTPRRPRP